MNNDLISIIIPIYNIMDCLEKCVDSCINQTYQNIEIIMVDDGSSDGTSELCDKLKEKDERIRVFHKENGGSSSARNLGIEEAKGEYLGFVDSDDFISSNMYEDLMNAILEYKVPIAQVSRDEIDASGNKLPDVCIPPEKAFSVSGNTDAAPVPTGSCPPKWRCLPCVFRTRRSVPGAAGASG